MRGYPLLWIHLNKTSDYSYAGRNWSSIILNFISPTLYERGSSIIKPIGSKYHLFGVLLMTDHSSFRDSKWIRYFVSSPLVHPLRGQLNSCKLDPVSGGLWDSQHCLRYRTYVWTIRVKIWWVRCVFNRNYPFSHTFECLGTPEALRNAPISMSLVHRIIPTVVDAHRHMYQCSMQVCVFL